MGTKVLTGHKRYSNIGSIRERAGQQAEVVKLVDTQRSGRCALTGMGVRVPPSAPHRYMTTPQAASRAACGVFLLRAI